MNKNSFGETLRFGLIGAGRIAQSYLQAFRQTPNSKLVAVADVSREIANAVAAEAGCAAYYSHTDLANHAKIDAVIVATPPDTHGPICLDFLTRGIPVLCEKPVSFDLAVARSIQKASIDNRVLFTMASKFRYAEDVLRARKIVESGSLGDIVLFENTFMSFVNMNGRWNADPKIGGGGVFIDNGTHSVDIMRYFIGPLDMIHAVEGPGFQGLDVEETVHVTTRAAGGAVGRMDLSWSIDKGTDDYILIYGSTGALRVGWKASYYRRSRSSDWVQFGSGYSKIQAFSDQITNFAAAIQGIQKPLITADDAVASVEVIQAGYTSLARDSWTVIPPQAALANSAFAA
jgi:predicted dehydrogenase